MAEEWVEVPWITGDTYETLDYRRCDFCDESFLQDCWAKRQTRKFFSNGSEIACEHCLPAAMVDEPIYVTNTKAGVQ